MNLRQEENDGVNKGVHALRLEDLVTQIEEPVAAHEGEHSHKAGRKTLPHYSAFMEEKQRKHWVPKDRPKNETEINHKGGDGQHTGQHGDISGELTSTSSSIVFSEVRYEKEINDAADGHSQGPRRSENQRVLMTRRRYSSSRESLSEESTLMESDVLISERLPIHVSTKSDSVNRQEKLGQNEIIRDVDPLLPATVESQQDEAHHEVMHSETSPPLIAETPLESSQYIAFQSSWIPDFFYRVFSCFSNHSDERETNTELLPEHKRGRAPIAVGGSKSNSSVVCTAASHNCCRLWKTHHQDFAMIPGS